MTSFLLLLTDFEFQGAMDSALDGLELHDDSGRVDLLEDDPSSVRAHGTTVRHRPEFVMASSDGGRQRGNTASDVAGCRHDDTWGIGGGLVGITDVTPPVLQRARCTIRGVESGNRTDPPTKVPAHVE